MHGSQSSPSLQGRRRSVAGAVTPLTIPNRGAHEVGSVKGIAEEVYVPQALWTESVGSPLKNRTIQFDADQFCADVLRKQVGRSSMRQFLTQKLSNQLEKSSETGQTLARETMAFAQSNLAETQRTIQDQTLAVQEKDMSRTMLRATLGEQTALNAQRVEERKLRDKHEAAEMNLSNVKQLCKQLAEQGQRKKLAKAEAASAMRELEARRLQERTDKQREDEQFRVTLQNSASPDAYRRAAQQDRLRAVQASQDATAKHWTSTVGKQELMQQTLKQERLDKDAQQQLFLQEKFYAKREKAREKQKQRMVETLNHQVASKSSNPTLERVRKESECAALNEVARKGMEQDLQRAQAKRAQEVDLQNTLLVMMADKQQKARSEGLRPVPAAATMTVTPSMLATAAMRSSRAASTGSLPSPADLSQCMNASRYLERPCGREEAKPWVDADIGHRRGGVVGVCGSDGPMRSTMTATGGRGRHMTKSVEAAEQDQRLRSTWSEGLSSAELKAGQQAAARRASAWAADKSLTT